MFDLFENVFSKDVVMSADNNNAQPKTRDQSDLVGRFGGASFEQGLYRVVRASDVGEWNARVTAAFPDFAKRIACFGFDWLGRAFATDAARLERGRPSVLMFEPGTGETLEIPRDVVTFHNEELLEYRDAALASEFHKRWLASGGAIPQYGQCVGYKKPLFLGGTDDLDNLTISDIDVYWHLMAQVIRKTKLMPPGTPVRVTV